MQGRLLGFRWGLVVLLLQPPEESQLTYWLYSLIHLDNNLRFLPTFTRIALHQRWPLLAWLLFCYVALKLPEFPPLAE